MKKIPKGIYKRTKETRKVLSEAQKGNKNRLGKHSSEETKRKLREINLGKEIPENTKEKMSKIAKEKGFGLWMKGKHLSEETKKKLSIINKGKPATNKGKPAWNRGVHPSEEVKNKMSESHKGIFLSKEHKEKISKGKKGKYIGELSSAWQGGISFIPYPQDWTDYLRESIRKRDDYTCQICEVHQDELEGRIKKLVVHHINYNKDDLNPNNLIILCHSCHAKTNANRKYWIEYFNTEGVKERLSKVNGRHYVKKRE